MKQRKWNALLTVFSLVGGFAGFLTGELVLARWGGEWHETVLMGVYFGQLAFWVGLGCLLAEIIAPRLNGQEWRLRYARDGWKFLVPATVVVLFAAGTLLQFIYAFYWDGRKPVQDYVLVMDRSGSMNQTDPKLQSIAAAQSLIKRMDKQKRVAVIAFNEQANVVQPFVGLKDPASKDQAAARIASMPAPDGQTDIGKALSLAREQIDNGGGRKAAVILISDGYSEVNLDQALSPFVQRGIAVDTVGFNPADEEGNRLLLQIASATGGSFHNVERADRIVEAFGAIYTGDRAWHLAGERSGEAAGDIYRGWMRIGMLAIIGSLMGLALGIIFDNRFLAKSFMIGGIVAGLAAGLILEAGLQRGMAHAWYRAEADLLLALVLSFSTLLVAVGDSAAGHTQSSGWLARRGLGDGRTVKNGRRAKIGKQFR
ncbi:VWA domain-containing protein [Paenibacillus allorhizosphaerae]|uniref:vWA domain-containing protein n=1 Tax=Paenibacillus allorhizosphaerae TaxID=2849866 RepID=UPI001C405C8B|nr:vWA domain-containing protein [Paenibacillus allorhizosphaerae]